MQLVTITIVNWEKYNPRADRGNYSWLRFENSFFENQRIFGLNAQQKVLLIFFLCQASKKGGGTFELDLNYIANNVHDRKDQLLDDIQLLNKLGFVMSANGRLDAAIKPTLLPATERNVTERNVTRQIHAVFDFDSFYKRYPRKMGKGKGIEKLKKEIKTQADMDLANRQLDNFLIFVAREKTETHYIPYFSTWVNSRGDWTDSETGSGSGAPKKTLLEELEEHANK